MAATDDVKNENASHSDDQESDDDGSDPKNENMIDLSVLLACYQLKSISNPEIELESSQSENLSLSQSSNLSLSQSSNLPLSQSSTKEPKSTAKDIPWIRLYFANLIQKYAEMMPTLGTLKLSQNLKLLTRSNNKNWMCG